MHEHILNHACSGLCTAFDEVTGDDCNERILIDVLGIEPPKRRYNVWYWWRSYHDKPRLKAITKALKKLQP